MGDGCHRTVTHPYPSPQGEGLISAREMFQRAPELIGRVAAADDDDHVVLARVVLLGQDFRRLHDLAHRLQQQAPGGRAHHALHPHDVVAARMQQGREPHGEGRPVDAVIDVEPRRCNRRAGWFIRQIGQWFRRHAIETRQRHLDTL